MRQHALTRSLPLAGRTSLRRAPAYLFAWLTLLVAAAGGTQEPPPVEPVPIAPPPAFTRWSAQTRWDEAQAVEWAAGYDKLKVAEAIEAWKMFLNLYPRAGMANEAAWHITTLTTRYGQLPRTIGAYEQYVQEFPDGDYAESALWNVTYQYMGVPDWETVYDTYDEFLKRFPASPYGDVALNGLASNARTKQRYELANKLYRELLQRYPTSDYCDDAWYGLGGVASACYRVEEAEQAFLTLAQQYPHSDLVESGLMQLVLLYYSTRESLKAIELGGEFLTTFPHSPYASTVQTYMYYASQSVLRARPDLAIDLPQPENPNEPTVVLPRERTEAYERATRAANLLELAEAVRLYQEFIDNYPTASQVDDALYGIGNAYAKLETYVAAAKKAKTPEQLGQVEADWRWVTEGPAAAQVVTGKPVDSAVDAYLRLTLTMDGSDLRDDALYKTGVAYEGAEDWVSAVRAYLALIELFPVSAYAPTAVSRLNALLANLKQDEDKATVRRAIGRAYPHHDLADDYVYELGIEALEEGDVNAARDLFGRYSQEYPSRSKAAEALFWQARCEQLLGNGVRARGLYAELATRFTQSGLADDAYAEYQQIAGDEAQAVLDVAQKALTKASAVVGEPLIGYDAITRDHVMILVPSDRAIDLRAYNVVDRLEQAYGLLAQACGYAPRAGARVVMVVDAKAGGPTPGDPSRMPVSMVTTPPPWRQWFEVVTAAFLTDPATVPVANAIPGIGQGAARYAAVQLEEFVFADLGETQVGTAALQAHLGDLNRTKGAAVGGLAAHAQAKATADKIDATIGLGIVWSLADALAGTPGEIINWTPILPLFQGASAIPAEVAAQAETLEQKSALVAHWVNTSLGQDFTATLRAWGLPITAEELQKVQAAMAPAQPVTDP